MTSASTPVLYSSLAVSETPKFRMSNTQLMASPLNACADSSFRAERLFKVFLSEEILEQGEYVWRV